MKEFSDRDEKKKEMRWTKDEVIKDEETRTIEMIIKNPLRKIKTEGGNYNTVILLFAFRCVLLGRG